MTDIMTVIITLIVILLLNQYVVGFARVQGESMYPTLDDGDMVIQDKITKNYDRFDVVIIKINSVFLIKRVIALPGETIQIIDDDIYINNTLLDDAISTTMGDYGIAAEKITLGPDEYFVMSDNRSNSKDSLNPDIGIIQKDNIKGRIVWKLPITPI